MVGEKIPGLCSVTDSSSCLVFHNLLGCIRAISFSELPLIFSFLLFKGLVDQNPTEKLIEALLSYFCFFVSVLCLDTLCY